MTKVCSNCGKKVEDNVNFCPYCRGTSFKGEITQSSSKVVVHKGQQSNLVYKLFYWDTNKGYMLSKSKIASISTFLFFIFCIFCGAPAVGTLMLAFLFSALVFLLSFAVHKFLGRDNPNPVLAKYNDYGLIMDLKHLLFYWQDKKTGGFVLSKTKLCCHIIFLIFAVIIVMVPPLNLAAAIMGGLMAETPAFLIGYGIHKLTNPMKDAEVIEKKVEKPKEVKKTKSKPIISTPFKVKKTPSEIEGLKQEFEQKESKVRDLIEKRFEPPQLTYTRFIALVDKSKEIFDKEYDSLSNLIELGDESSPRIASEIDSKKKILKSIIEKIDDLTSELVITMDDDDDREVDNLIDDMEDLIKSVKDYDN